MGFQAGFIDQIQAIAVSQVIPVGIVGIMGSADRVDVVGLQDADVFFHLFPGDGSAVCRREFMAVDSAQNQPFAIQFQDSINNFNLTDTDILNDSFHQGFLIIKNIDFKPVKFRMFS